MYLAICPKNFNKDFLMISDKTKNNVIGEGSFYRLYYSGENGTVKGLFLDFHLECNKVDKYFNKLKCEFDRSKNAKIIDFIQSVERSILNIVPDKKNKKPVFRVDEQLQNGFIKIFYDNESKIPEISHPPRLLLKISGIWTNDREYGITFRFFFIRP